MDSKAYIKKIGVHTCIYYTAATFLILFLFFVLNTDLSGGVQPVALICLLPFSILFATANVMFGYTDWKTTAKVPLHYALILGGAISCLYLPNKDPDAGASQGFILFLVLSLLYIIIMATYLGLKARIYRVKRDESHYKSLYKQDKDEITKEEKDNKKKKSKKDKDDYQNVYKKK